MPARPAAPDAAVAERPPERAAPPAEPTVAAAAQEPPAEQVLAATPEELPAEPIAAEVADSPVPRRRAEQPPRETTERTPRETVAESAETQDESPATPSPGTAESAGPAAQNATRALQAASAALARQLPGVGSGGSGSGQGGTPGGAAMQARGSELAQACLDRAGVFQAHDSITATFEVQVDKSRRTLDMDGNYELHSGRPISAPRVGQIERTLNRCSEFVDFVLAQPGLNTFRFDFSSGRR